MITPEYRSKLCLVAANKSCCLRNGYSFYHLKQISYILIKTFIIQIVVTIAKVIFPHQISYCPIVALGFVGTVEGREGVLKKVLYVHGGSA